MKKAVNNGIIYLLASIITQLINLFLIPLYTRNLSVYDVGIYNIISSIQALLAICITLGVYSGMIRFFNEVTDKNKLKNVTITFSIIWSVFIFIVIYSVNGFLGRVFIDGNISSGKYVVYISLISIFECLIAIYTSYYSMKFKAIRVSIINISNILLRFIISYYFIVKWNYGILGLLIAQMIATSIVAIVLIICDIKNYKFAIDIKQLKSMLTYGIGLLPGQVSAWILTLIDRYFLKGMTGVEYVAIYSMAYKVGMLINPVFINPFTNIFTPVKFSVYKELNGKKQIKKYFYVYNFLGWFCILGLSLSAKIFISILSTKEYLAGVNLVLIIAFSYFLWGLGQFYSLGLHIANKMLLNSGVVTIGAVINIVCNFIFIPYMGMYGAAVATCLAYVVTNGMYYYYGNKYYNIKMKFLEPYKLGIVVTGLYFLYLEAGKLYNSIIIEFILIVVLLLAYIIISVKLKAIPKDTMDKIISKIKRRILVISDQYKIKVSRMDLILKKNEFNFMRLTHEKLEQMYKENSKELDSEKYKILENRINKYTIDIESYIVVDKDNNICGYFHIAYQPIWVNECNWKINKSSTEAYLFDDYVFNNYRGNGVQKFSIQSRLNILEDKGYKFATVIILRDNIASRKSYVDIGFRRYRQFMVIKFLKFKKTFIKNYSS